MMNRGKEAEQSRTPEGNMEGLASSLLPRAHYIEMFLLKCIWYGKATSLVVQVGPLVPEMGQTRVPHGQTVFQW